MKKIHKYIFDANCFIEPWNKFYSYEFFAPFWDEFIKDSCAKGQILVQREIYDEILKKDDELNAWVKKLNIEIIETDASITRSVAEINNEFPKLIKEVKGRSMADPFVIALARREGATVVTLEDTGSDVKPKIPYVCKMLKVRCINLYDFLKESETKFGVSSSK